jgi:hypothetical protein
MYYPIDTEKEDESTNDVDEFGIKEAKLPFRQIDRGKKIREKSMKRMIDEGGKRSSYRKRHKKETPERIHVRNSFILNCLNACWTISKIQSECERRFGTKKATTLDLVKKFRLDRADEFKEQKGKYKSEQVMRLQSDLAKMRKLKHPPWTAIARHEEMLVRIVGTAEPVKTETNVNINVRESMLQVVQRLEDSVVDSIIAEQLTLEAEAKQSRYMLNSGFLVTELQEEESLVKVKDEK